MDRVNLLDQVLDRLQAAGVRFCAIGGVAVNAYVEPVVTLDLDLAVATGDLAAAERALSDFHIERFPHSVNVTAPGSDLRVRLQTDERYAAFVTRAAAATVLGVTIPIAAIEDVLQGKVWAAGDPSRRASKRQKDLADIARLVERYPELRSRVPSAILQRLL